MVDLSSHKKEILDIIFKYISKDECVIFLFGSFAKNDIYPSSDIDIGIVCNKPIENRVLVMIKEEIERVRTLRDIDIIDFAGIKDAEFLKSALEEVRIWYQSKKSRSYLDNLKKLSKD